MRTIVAIFGMVLSLSACATVPRTLSIATDVPGATIAIEGSTIKYSGTATLTPKSSKVAGRVEAPGYDAMDFSIPAGSRSGAEQYESTPYFVNGVKSPFRFLTPILYVATAGLFAADLVIPNNFIGDDKRLGSNAVMKTKILYGGFAASAVSLLVTLPFVPNRYYGSTKISMAGQYDAEGFHTRTGLDHWGVDREGKMSDGSTFHGKTVEGKKTGFGFWDLPSQGHTIVGYFQEDLVTGLTWELPLGSTSLIQATWIGNYSAGKKDGIGVSLQSGQPGEIQEWSAGTLKSTLAYPANPPIKSSPPVVFLSLALAEGLAEGTGFATSLDGFVRMTGTFSKGYLVKGTVVFADGAIQQGSFADGHLVTGIWKSGDGSMLEGTWDGGKLQSPAKFTFSDGTVYEGSHNNSVRNGNGTLRTPEGDSYTGTFVHGTIEGKGTYTFASGTVYTGELKGGTFEGKGLLAKANGESFEGPFVGGVPDGSGIYKFSDRVERAEYYQGKRIDQAYQIREARRLQELEDLRAAEAAAIAEQKRQEAEQVRLAQEAANRKAEQNRIAAAQWGRLGMGLIAGGLTGAILTSQGASGGEALLMGASMATDFMNGTVGSSSSTFKQSGDAVLAARASTAAAASKRDATASFLEAPTVAATPPAEKVKATPIRPESNHFADDWGKRALNGTFVVYTSVVDSSSLGVLATEGQIYPSFLTANSYYAEYRKACEEGDKARSDTLLSQHRMAAEHAIDMIDAYMAGDQTRAKFYLPPNGSRNMREAAPTSKP